MAIKIILVYIICIWILPMQSKGQSAELVSTQWREAALRMYFDSLKHYEAHVLPDCFNHDRDRYFDISRKVLAINSFPFGMLLDSVKSYVVGRSIEYDSIHIHFTYGPIDDELYGIHTSQVILFNQNGIEYIKYKYSEIDVTFWFSSELKRKDYNKLVSEQHGCGFGIYLHTRILFDFSWEIIKLII